jgi:multiple sugar transport system substrate-binding protein
MKIKKLSLLSFCLIFILSIPLAGCSNSQSTAGSSGVTTVTFWNSATGIGKTALDAAIKEFNNEHPHIKVVSTYVASNESSDNKLLTAVAGGNPPDITEFDRFKVASWAKQGSLTDLSDYAKKDGVSKSQYYPFAWDEASYKGKIYAMPIDTDSRLLYYNKDEFKKAGLDPNNPPKTIEQLEQDAQKLTIKQNGHIKQLGFAPWLSQGWLYTWGWAFGGEFYNSSTGKVTANDPKIVQALQWEQDWANKYNAKTITSFANSTGANAEDPFVTGQIAMKVDVTGAVQGIQMYKPNLNYGVAPIPTPTGTNSQTWSGGFSLVIPKGAKNADAAWKFAKFMGSPKGQKILASKEGGLSVIKSVNQEIYTKPPMKIFADLLDSSHNRPAIAEGQLLWNDLDNAVSLAINNKGTPKQILDNVTKDVNAALKKD